MIDTLMHIPDLYQDTIWIFTREMMQKRPKKIFLPLPHNFISFLFFCHDQLDYVNMITENSL